MIGSGLGVLLLSALCFLTSGLWLPAQPTPPRGGSGTAVITTNEFDASAIISGTLNDARLPNTISSDITGNAATATTLTNYYRLSDYMTSDTDLTIGVTNVGVDRSALIQSILDHATNLNSMTVHWNVSVTAGGLLWHDNVKIVGEPGCGFRLPGGANKPLISNSRYHVGTNQANWATAPDLDAVVKNKNLTMEDMILDGNERNQAHDTAGEGWMVGMRIFNAENVFLKRVKVQSARTFAYHFSNVDGVGVSNCEYDMGVGVPSNANQDGLHFHSARNVMIQGFAALGNDDAIALNADDLDPYSGFVRAHGPYGARGPIDNVQVSGLQLRGAWTGTNWVGSHGVRILSGTNRIDNIAISGVSGTYGDHLLIIDNFSDSPTSLGGAGPGNIGSVTFNDVNVTISDSLNYKQAAVYFGSRVENLTMNNWTLKAQNGDSRPFVVFNTVANGTADVHNVTMNNWKLIGQTNTAAPLNHMIRVTGASRIGNWFVNDLEVQVRDNTNRQGTLIYTDTSATITNLAVDGLKAPGLMQVFGSTNAHRVSIKNSDVAPLIRGEGVVNRVQPHPTMPDTWNVFSPASAGFDAMVGGQWMKWSNSTFSVVVKLPDPWNGSSPSILTRLTYWPVTGGALNGYALGFNLTGVTMYSVNTSYTSVSNRTATLTAGLEYRPQIETYGNEIRGYIQRLNDETWLAGDGTWTAGRKPCILYTNSAWTTLGLYHVVSHYSTTTTTPLRIREIQAW